MEHEMDEWRNDLEQHIRHCQCTCNHMGYGNYLSFKDHLHAADHETTMAMNMSDHHLDRMSPLPWRTLSASSTPQPHHNHLLHLHHQASRHSPSSFHGSTILTGPGPPLGIPPPPASISNGQNGIGIRPDRHFHRDDDDTSSTVSRGSRIELGGKQWCVLCIALLVALGTGVGVAVPLALRSTATAHERLDTAHNILAQVPLVDGHNDLPWNIRKFSGGKLHALSLAGGLQHEEPWSKSVWSHTDLPRLREGRVGAQFWSVYVPCGAQYLDAVKQTLEQIDLIKRMIQRHSDYLRLAVDARGIEESHHDGRIASLLGIEGGHSLGNSLAVLRTFYDLGARLLTLTHTCNTPWADCSIAEAEPNHPRHGGLTPFGKLVIREMNRLGMIVDLSHGSAATMHHTLDVSKAPVIFSHSSTRALCNITRNVPDDVLRRLAANGGIVMVSFFSHFVTCNKTSTTADVIAHINHIRTVAGVDHVGIGAGYDGINSAPQGLEDVSRYPHLFAELLQDPRWSEEDLKKLAGLNFLRVFRQVEEIRDAWKRANVLAEETSIANEDLKGHTQCTYQERGSGAA